MKIRTYLLLMIGAIIVPVFLLAAIALRTLLHSEREAALHTLSETASATALLVDRELGSAESALRVLARSPHLANGDLQGFYRHATSADRGDGGRTILFAPSGRQLINTVQPLGAPLPPPPDYVRTRTRRVIETQKTVVSGLISGAVQRIPVTTINIPVPLDGGRRYVLASVFSPDYFSKVIARRPLSPGWKLSVVDTEGHLIARSGEPARLNNFANPALMRAAAGRDQGLARYDTRAGVDAYTAFFRSPMSGWLIAVTAPARDIEGAARQAVRLAAAGMLLALLCAAAGAACCARSRTRAARPPCSAAAKCRTAAAAGSPKSTGCNMRCTKPAPGWPGPRPSAPLCCTANRKRGCWPSSRSRRATISWPCSAMNCATRSAASSAPPSCCAAGRPVPR